jgi:hypothetical protein
MPKIFQLSISTQSFYKEKSDGKRFLRTVHTKSL